MNKITTYFKESYNELLEKVTWPTWNQLQQSTDYCTCSYCYHYRNGVGYGLFKQPIAEVDLFIIQVI